MYKLLGAMLGLCLMGTATADASLLIDDFNVPGGIGASQNAGPNSPTNINPATLSAPNFFGSRTLTGVFGASGLSVSGSNLDAVFTIGQVGGIVWGTPLGTPTSIDNLTFSGFILSSASGSIGYDVQLTSGGTTNSIGSGLLGSNGIMQTAPTIIGNPGDVLTINFTGLAALARFEATGIEATPEPASIGLLGLAMFGGVCRHRKRRKA